MRSLQEERFESIKAGLLSSAAFTLAYIAIVLINHFWLVNISLQLTPLKIAIGTDLLFKLAVSCLSGFLFGITYRYIIRKDDNSHLSEGAVLAFGLVRGLATVEGKDDLLEIFWCFSLLTIESLICFAIARFTLDFALHQAWIKPYKS